MASKVISKDSTLDEEVIDVLSYWFGTAYWNKQNETFSYYDELWRKKWFAKEADQVEADAYIKEYFGNTLELAIQGKFTDTWCKDHHSCLALIIVLDQFTRNVYRDDSRAWSGDKLALQVCLEAIGKGMDKKFPLIARCQFYMPLIHAEDMEIQEKCLSLYKEIVQESPPSIVEISKRFLKISHEQLWLVKQFGRFPQRNEYLNRISTPEEQEYVSHRHYDTIATFGRYPERNKLLHRPSTAKEKIYLSA